MDIDRCIKFATENPLVWVATDDEGQPRMMSLEPLPGLRYSPYTEKMNK